MTKFQTLRDEKLFKKAFSSGKSWHTPYAVVFYLKDESHLVGFVASKKVGNAVKRNRAKRRLRALFGRHESLFLSGTYVFVAKNPITDEEYLKIEDSFLLSMKRLNTIKR